MVLTCSLETSPLLVNVNGVNVKMIQIDIDI